MTEWHLGWQRAVPPERREVVMGPHRANIVTVSGGVVEIQHSPIPADVIGERETFYGDRMLWIFNCTRAEITVSPAPPLPGKPASTPCGCADERCARLWAQHRPRPGNEMPSASQGCTGHMTDQMGEWEPSPEVRFRWKRARASLAACRRPVLLDLGGGHVLRPGEFIPAAEMTGVLYTRASIEAWLREGTPWERIILPPEVPAPWRSEKGLGMWRCPCVQCAVRRAQVHPAP